MPALRIFQGETGFTDTMRRFGCALLVGVLAGSGCVAEIGGEPGDGSVETAEPSGVGGQGPSTSPTPNPQTPAQNPPVTPGEPETPTTTPPVEKTTWGDGTASLTGADAGPAEPLATFRWEVPCINNPGPNDDICKWNPAVFQQVWERRKNFGGDPTKLYDVTLRFRGVVEGKLYNDASGKRFEPAGSHPVVLKGGTPILGTGHEYNQYLVKITEPASVTFLNAIRAEDHWVWAIDFTETLRVKGGAEILLGGYDGNDQLVTNVVRTTRGETSAQALNQPLTIPGVPPFPAPYNGQFVQMDVTHVVTVAP